MKSTTAVRFIRNSGMRLIFLLPAFLCAMLSASAAPDPRPNLIVILADDMGYSDPACFGGELATPAIDRLASRGVRLTQFRNGGMCVISRASMLTGQWWPRALPEFAATPLLSESLHRAGYRTGLFGKWHLQGSPMDRGFDHFFGFLEGFADHFSGAASYRLDRAPFTDFPPDFYSTDALTDRAIQFVSAPQTAPRPFFLYLSYQAPHNPLQVPAADIAAHRGKYLGGWQAVREARFRRQKELGILPANASLPAYPKNLPDWSSLSPAQRDLEDLRMAVYAAMVERMDRGIGRLMAALEKSGLSENTLVVFMSDNGADSFSVMDDAMLKNGKLPGDPGSNWQLGTGWAYASVTPWRLYKISQHTGGVTTGAIAVWPAGVKSPGRVEHTALHMVDLVPTFLDAATLGKSGNPGPGISFVPLLRGESIERDSPQYFQYMDNRAIRTKRWTLAEIDGSGWQLFDVTADPMETHDLSQSFPDQVSQLDAQWNEWWRNESPKRSYQPESTATSGHYKPQGDQGTGEIYQPRAMPASLAGRYPLTPVR